MQSGPMKLQLALDHFLLSDALRLLESVADLVDIVEAGTPLLLSEGVRAVREIRGRFPALTVLADFKIMDAGELEARLAFESGAHIVTVLGAAEDVTIRKACAAARAAGAQVMVDLIAVEDPAARMKQVMTAGPAWFCCHAAFDTADTGGNPLADLAALRGASAEAGLAVAGGITPERLPALRPYAPAIAIVGGFVARARDPRAALLSVRAAMG
jgi:3-hexulose-6-phosphate synthase